MARSSPRRGRERAQRTKAEQRLRASEEHLRLIFEGAPIGMALVGVDGSFLRVNPALCAIVGYSADELMATTFQAITHPDDLGTSLDHLNWCLDGSIDGYQLAKRYVHREGHEVWVELNVGVVRDARGVPSHFVSQSLDITERRAALALVAASEARFEAMVEHGSDLISITDRVGRLVYASPAYRTLLGFDPAEWIGQTFDDQIHPEDRPFVLATGTALAGRPGGTATLDFRFAHADGSWRWFEATITNRIDDPAVGGFVTNIHDVTERVLTRENLSHQATHDPLTGLPNRTLLDERIAQARAAAARHGEVLAALYVDIDHFKRVNDTYGHSTGDLLLIDVATRLRLAARADDTVVRLGGDEFVIIASVGDEAAAGQLAARVCRSFGEPFVLDDLTLAVRASVGVATTGGSKGDVDLLDAADIALYEAKAVGRNGWVAYLPHLQRRSDWTELRPDARIELLRISGRYREHIAEATQPVVVHAEGLIVAVSPPTLCLLGAESEAELLGRHVFELVSASSLSKAHAREGAVQAGGWPQPEVLEIATTSGGALAVEVTSTPVFWEGTLASQLTLRRVDDQWARSGAQDEADADLLRELSVAIAEGQLAMAYQPIVDRAGNVQKVEALVRWRHPRRGLLPPCEFIPAAERSPLMASLTSEILRQSCLQVAEWRREGMPDLELAVNISGQELGDSGLVYRVLAALDASGLPADALWLEITETALAKDAERAGDALSRISALGVRIALDDFGTGFATLAQLHQFTAHALKIDRLFVDGIGGVAGGDGDVAIVRSILALGRELGLVVIGEGVETEEQRDILVRMGCELFQGFLFACPTFADVHVPWLPARRGPELSLQAGSGTQLPWKPSGTRLGSSTLATGPSAGSAAGSTRSSERSAAAS